MRQKTKNVAVGVSEPKNFKLLKRIVLQIIICLLIYCIFYLINTTNYTFSDVALEKARGLLSYDVDFIEICSGLIKTVNSYIYNQGEEGENIIESIENYDEENMENITEENIEENIINNEDEETTEQNEISSVESSETDRIKNSYSFIVPINRNNFL